MSLRSFLFFTVIALFSISLPATQAQDTYSLERGDIITVVNGETIGTINQYQRLVRISNFKIEFSIRKSNGTEMSLTTTLRKARGCNLRFGTDIAHNRGDGVRVTFVHPKGPGSRCQVVNKP